MQLAPRNTDDPLKLLQEVVEATRPSADDATPKDDFRQTYVRLTEHDGTTLEWLETRVNRAVADRLEFRDAELAAPDLQTPKRKGNKGKAAKAKKKTVPRVGTAKRRWRKWVDAAAGLWKVVVYVFAKIGA